MKLIARVWALVRARGNLRRTVQVKLLPAAQPLILVLSLPLPEARRLARAINDAVDHAEKIDPKAYDVAGPKVTVWGDDDGSS